MFTEREIEDRIAKGMNPNYAVDPWYVPGSPEYPEEIHPVMNSIQFINQNLFINRDGVKVTKRPERFATWDLVFDNMDVDFYLWKRISKMQVFPDDYLRERIRLTAKAFGYEEKVVEQKKVIQREPCPPEIKEEIRKNITGMYVKSDQELRENQVKKIQEFKSRINRG